MWSLVQFLQQLPLQSTFSAVFIFGFIRICFDRVVFVPPSIFLINSDCCNFGMLPAHTFAINIVHSLCWYSSELVAQSFSTQPFSSASTSSTWSSMGNIRRLIVLLSSHFEQTTSSVKRTRLLFFSVFKILNSSSFVAFILARSLKLLLFLFWS